MPSVHQSVFVKPEHEVVTFVRWQPGHSYTDDPYAEVHINVDDFNVCLFVDRTDAPKFALTLNHLSQELLGPGFGVWCLAPIERVCPLCDRPSPDGEVHRECAGREQHLADAAAESRVL